MPSARLDNNSVDVLLYDVVGKDSETQQYFIYHVGLAGAEINLTGSGQFCKVFHMGPPLEHFEQMELDVHGTAKLTYDEIKQIENFYNERYGEYETSRRHYADQYHFHPAVLPLTSSDGTIKYFRFSCAGFVLASYREAGINLVSDSDLPFVDLSRVQSFYSFLSEPVNRDRFGPKGDGP